MLHQIKLPAYSAILNDFLDIQQRILEFACTPAKSDPLTLTTVKNTFPGDIGNWLWSKLWGPKSKTSTPLYEELSNLTQYITNNPNEREGILKAFEHDITFYDHLNDPTFQFEYRNLPEETRNVVKPLMVSFYNLLVEGILLFGQKPEQYFNRKNVAIDFWTENKVRLKVCPACDGGRPHVTKRRAYSDVDHFFPKSLYPFLSIHAYNLVPTCTDCNRYFKKSTDPIEDHTQESLVDTFHPYGRPAIVELNVQIIEGTKGQLEVHFDDDALSKQGGVSTRIKNMNRLFNLKERWEEMHLPYATERIEQVFRDARRRKEEGELRDDAYVKERLQDVLCDPISKIGKQPFYIMEKSYAQFILTNKEEFARLAELAGVEQTAEMHRY